MSDTKQETKPLNLTVQFTDDERRTFNMYCADHGWKKGAFIRLLVMGVADGKIDIGPLLEH